MAAFYVLVRYAGQNVDVFDLLIVLAATAIAGVVPITVGGLGLMEGAIGATLALFGVGPGAAFAVAAANRLVMLASSATGGLGYLRSREGLWFLWCRREEAVATLLSGQVKAGQIRLD
jgi:uncharacterized membrane protein YbhN (UPF0104 family)